MNSENSKTSKPHILLLKLTDKLDLRLDKNVIALSNLSIYYTWNKIKSSYNNNKFKISAPTWNEEFTLPDGSYKISDIQDYFEYYLMDLIRYQIFRITLNIFLTSMEKKLMMMMIKIIHQ